MSSTFQSSVAIRSSVIRWRKSPPWLSVVRAARQDRADRAGVILDRAHGVESGRRGQALDQAGTLAQADLERQPAARTQQARRALEQAHQDGHAERTAIEGERRFVAG